MKHLRFALLAAGTALAIGSTDAHAQDSDVSIAAYIALTYTPPGAFPSLLARTTFDPAATASVLHLRYGTIEEAGDRAHSVGATGEFPFWKGRLSFTAGVQTASFTTAAMVGVDFQGVLSRSPMGTTPDGPQLIMLVKPEFGVGTAVEGEIDASYVSGGVSVPMTIPIGREIVFAPYVTPGLGWGMLIEDGAYTAEIRPMAGVGIVIHNPSRIDLTIGFHKVFIEGGSSTLGLGLTWNR